MPTHDHEILVGATTTKLWLAQGSNGAPMATVQEEIPEHMGRLELWQNDWSRGHGQYIAGQAGMFFDGQSIEITQEGRVFLGPEINEVYQAGLSTAEETYSTGLNLTIDAYSDNGVAQTFTAGSSYTIGAVKLPLSRAAGYPGIISVSIYNTTAGAPTGAPLCTGVYDANTLTEVPVWTTITLPPVALTNGEVYAITLFHQDVSNVLHVKWSVNTTTGDGSARWFNGSVWAVYGATSQLGYETWAYTTGPLDSTPTCFLWAASVGKWLMADSANIYYLDGGVWVLAATTVSGVTALEEHDGVIYAARGSAAAYYYSTTGVTWTVTDLTDSYASLLLSSPNGQGTQNVLWKGKTPNELAYTTDGRTVAAGGVQWTLPPAYIGDTSSDMTHIFTSGDELMVGRADNLFYYDSDGGIHSLKPDLKTGRSANNFKYVCDYRGATYCSVGTGVAEIIGGHLGTYDIMGPLTDTDDIDKVGIVVGMTSDSNFLYVAMLEGTVVHIYKGRRVEGAWSWCPWVYLGTNQCSTIRVAQHSATDRRLWFGYGLHTGWVQITDNPTTDATARFAASGMVRMSYLYGTNPYFDKMIQTIITETVGCAAGQTVQPTYRKDSETSMTNLTAAITTNGVVSTALTSALTGKRIQFALNLATSDNTLTPQVRLFSAKGNEKPEVFRIHECTYMVGSQKSRLAKTVRTALRAAQTSTSLIKLADLRYSDTGLSGTSGTDWVYVVLEPGYPHESEVTHEKDRTPDLLITVRWREVNV